MKKRIISALVCIFIISFSLGCGNQKKIDNYTIDAEYALKHGDYDGAKTAYNNILALDKENRTAIYGIKDLEEAARKKDEDLCAQLHSALCEGILTHELDEKSSYITPVPGDYSLVDFVNNSGNAYWDYVYNQRMNSGNGYGVQSMLVSWDKDGNKLTSKEIRVALYSLSKSGIELCVYVPDSYDPISGDIISAGVKYNPAFDFSNVSVDCTVIGVHSHAILVDENGDTLKTFTQGQILYSAATESNITNNKRKTALNPANQYVVLSNTDLIPINVVDIGGIVLEDEFGNYYITCGKLSEKSQELKCISEQDAMDSLYYSRITVSFDRIN